MSIFPVKIGVEELTGLSGTVPLIDVRTPSEYLRGHIPGAVNIPLFSDNERAVVGTIYKQNGQIEAIIKGFDIAGPRMSELLKEGIQKAGWNNRLMIHCWRGGKRSESMAWLFSNAGIECMILEGGYKAYRNHILSELGKQRKMIVLGGLTGSGKTAILAELRSMGEQVIDLEALANHKGSAFGALGQEDQPSSEHFSNMLFTLLNRYDPDRRLFIEDESHRIGHIHIPDNFFDQMHRAEVIALMPDIKTRIPRLREDYGLFPADSLIESVERISRKLGGDNASKAIAAIRDNDLDTAIEIVLNYYDKAYRYGLSRRPSSAVRYITGPADDPRKNAVKVLSIADDITVS